MQSSNLFTLDQNRASGNIEDVLNSDSQEKQLNGIELTEQQKDYLLPHFSMLVVGKPGSGKTSLVKALLTNPNYYYKKFDNVIIISPSANKMGISVKKQNVAQQLDLGWLQQRLIEINQNQVRDIIKELKHDGKLRPFEPEEKKPMFAAAQENKKQMLPVVKRDETSHKLMSAALENSFNTTDALKRTPAVTGATSSASGESQQQTIAEYVDEMHKKYVTRMDGDEKRRTYKNVLIVMDDVVSSIKANENSPFLSELFFNRRHLVVNGMVSIMVISEKYTMVPARLRSNMSWLVLYRLNPVDFDNVFKDVIMMGMEQWKELLHYVYGDSYKSENDEEGGLKSHDTMGIWVEYDVLFKNFTRLKINHSQTGAPESGGGVVN